MKRIGIDEVLGNIEKLLNDKKFEEAFSYGQQYMSRFGRNRQLKRYIKKIKIILAAKEFFLDM